MATPAKKQSFLGGAAILTAHFWPRFGFSRALWLGTFHSVSAFCNAGFDIFGFLEPGASLLTFQNDPVVLLTLGALVIIGGLGFLGRAETLPAYVGLHKAGALYHGGPAAFLLGHYLPAGMEQS